MKLTGKTCALLLVVAGALVTAYWLLSPPLPPSESLPHPNGIDDLVAAGQMLRGNYPFSNPETVESLGGYVASNRAALDRARLGLTRQCREPVEYSMAYNSQHGYDQVNERRIAVALEAEGRLAELDNHPAEAATNYFTVIKLGVGLERGGTFLDLILGIICESRGITRLTKEVPKLTAEQSRTLAREVDNLEAGREAMEKIITHENARARSYVMGSVDGMKDLLLGRRWHPHFQQLVASQYQNQCRQTLELEASLAAHAFELEKGRMAQDWHDLVPAYLERIPLDPGTTNQWTFPLR